jgi:dihydroorotate dehydrogenase
MGITFKNPVGLAAGLDKDGAYIDALADLGFGSIEVGTVTPRAQPGNPKPRMFRLPEAARHHQPHGLQQRRRRCVCGNVQSSRFYQNKEGVLGLNIGKNADTPIERATDDYLHCLEKVYPTPATSPSTSRRRTPRTCASCKAARNWTACCHAEGRPLRAGRPAPALRAAGAEIAPDMDGDQVKNIADALIRHKIDGVIATNTTLNRDAVTACCTAPKRAACRARRCSSSRTP